MFERGFLGEGEHATDELRDLADRVELDENCRQLAGLNVQDHGPGEYSLKEERSSGTGFRVLGS